MTPTTRRELIRAGLAGSASLGLLGPMLSGCGATKTARGQEVVAVSRRSARLQLSWLPGVEWAGSYIADARGYYREAGFDVTIAPGGPDTAVEPLIATGRAFVGMDYAVGVAGANKNGADLRLFATHFQRAPQVIASQPANPIRTPQQLEGKRIGVPLTSYAALRSFMRATGGDPAKVTMVPIQHSLAPLSQGQVDGIWTFSPELYPLVHAGVEPVLMYLSDYGWGDVTDSYAASRATLTDHREELTRFMRAEIKGWQDFIADPEQGVRLVVDRFGSSAGLTEAEQTYEAQRYVELITYGGAGTSRPLFGIDAPTQARVLRLLRSQGQSMAATELFDDTLLPAVYAGASQITAVT